jgi:IclR helix-turn-helix domain
VETFRPPGRAIIRPLREMGLGEGSSSGRAAPTPPGPGSSLGRAATPSGPSPATVFGPPTVEIELTRSQILRVCEVAAGSESEADLRQGLAGDARSLCALLNEVARNPRPKFSKSLVSGLYVFASLPDDGTPVGIRRLAQLLEMPTATVHRYLHTLIEAELVQRDEKTREYSLAPGLAGDSAVAAENE